MNNKEKARELSKKFARQYHANNWPEWSDDESFHYSNEEINNACLEMAQWKDEQYKTAYVVTRSDLHYDEVEKVFFDKNKAEEYCKSYNEDEDFCHRDITKIEVSL